MQTPGNLFNVVFVFFCWTTQENLIPATNNNERYPAHPVNNSYVEPMSVNGHCK